MKRFLPIGVQDFGQMIRGNFVYVDKTRFVYEMAHVPQAFYFLSRPRRFGKSLLVSTLRALFEAKRELFKGLWIESSDWAWQAHPALTLDFNGIDASEAQTLEKSLAAVLDRAAKDFDLALENDILPNKFVELITALYKRQQQKIVVLIDEYDRPIISHLGQGEAGLQKARANREVLKKFFGVLKEANVSAALRFVFITGISKFSRVSIFSDLNNLQDLSMHEAYAGALGYTQAELESNFKPWIAEFAARRQTTGAEILQDLRTWYNGHRFTKAEAQVYNPFSILNAFAQYDFKSFWFDTATPSFLVNLMRERDYPIPNLESLSVQESAFSTYDLDNLELEALLFQTGYVTIQKLDGALYRLGYPNQEVKNSFLNYLYTRLVHVPDATLKSQFVRLHEYLANEDLASFIATANAVLSAIPYTQIHGQDERYYHTVFYLMLAASGVLVQTEVLTSQGRIDLAVEFKDKVYIVELKCNQPAEQALAQIRGKRYHEKYVQSGRKIFLLGLGFSTQERSISGWQLESLEV